MPRRWDTYELYIDDRLVETTTDYALARECYRIAARGVPHRHRAVRLVARRGPASRTILRKPRWPR